MSLLVIVTTNGFPSKRDTSGKCWLNKNRRRPSINQHWFKVSCLLGLQYSHIGQMSMVIYWPEFPPTFCASCHHSQIYIKHPSKHDTLTQYRFNVGSPSATLVQH